MGVNLQLIIANITTVTIRSSFYNNVLFTMPEGGFSLSRNFYMPTHISIKLAMYEGGKSWAWFIFYVYT